MDEKLKILLGSEDIIARDNEDIYLNINLNRNFYEYKKEKYDNDFDLAQQFDKERNLSRSFRLYGIVDSNVIDTNNIPIKVYSDSGTTSLVYQTNTTSMNFNESINVFNKKKGKYYISIDDYRGDSVFIKIESNNNNIATQIFEQKLVFYDFDGNFIPYGTETVEVDDNLNTIDINNNFPFFYNKHWVKKNISLQETKYSVVNFSGTNQTIYEGQTAKVAVFLDKPSPFGNEKVDFVPIGGTANLSDFSMYLDNNPSNVFSTKFQIGFSVGQQIRVVNILALPDSEAESLENYSFKLDNFIKVKSGSSMTYQVDIENSLPRKYAIYELTNLFENRTPYNGSTIPENPNTVYPIPSILRNGLYYNSLVNEFYPIDELTIQIENLSNNTCLLPIDSNLGNQDELTWSPGEVKTFNIKPQYSSSVLNEVSIYLPPSLNRVVDTSAQNGQSEAVELQDTQSSLEFIINSISINGFVLPFSKSSYQYYPNIIPPNGVSASYEALKLMLSESAVDVYNINNLHKPFIVNTDDSNYTITLISKSPGVRLDVDTNVKKSNLNVATSNVLVPYSYPKQVPFSFKLLGNQNNGSTANYKISFVKKSYKTLSVSYPTPTNTLGQVNYLTTCLSDVLHNWDSKNNKPIAFSGNPIQGDFSSGAYFLNKGKAYYLGLPLLGVSNDSDANSTSYGTQTEVPAIWLPNKINVIEKTNIEISNENVSQVGLLKINTPTSSTPLVSTDVDINFYSFDYKNESSSEYLTFYWNGSNNANSISNTGNGLNVSGSTVVSRNSPGLIYEIDQGVILGNQSIPVGPVNVEYPGYNTYEIPTVKFYSPYYPTTSTDDNIKYQNNGITEILLSAKSPGVSFEIKNIINNNTKAEFVFMPIAYNEKNGVTYNPYNNNMGGFSLTTP
jgi:hypothetical protein